MGKVPVGVENFTPTWRTISPKFIELFTKRRLKSLANLFSARRVQFQVDSASDITLVLRRDDHTTGYTVLLWKRTYY